MFVCQNEIKLGLFLSQLASTHAPIRRSENKDRWAFADLLGEGGMFGSRIPAHNDANSLHNLPEILPMKTVREY